MNKLNKLLISTFFLSSIATAGPCIAKGNADVGLGIPIGRDILSTTCNDFNLGRLSSNSLDSCLRSFGQVQGLAGNASQKEEKEVPYLIDMPSLLSQQSWSLGPIYIPERKEEISNQAVILLSIPVIVALLTMLGVFLHLRDRVRISKDIKEMSV